MPEYSHIMDSSDPVTGRPAPIVQVRGMGLSVSDAHIRKVWIDGHEEWYVYTDVEGYRLFDYYRLYPGDKCRRILQEWVRTFSDYPSVYRMPL